MIRRLTSDDADLLREAWEWDASRPSWYKQMDKVFFSASVEDFITMLDDWHYCLIGVFENDLIAIIIVEWKDNGQFEGHLVARRHANVGLIALAAEHVLYDMLDFGLEEASVWVAEKNAGVAKLCARIGLLPDGVVMYKGSYRGRLIKWLRHSVTREELLTRKAA